MIGTKLHKNVTINFKREDYLFTLKFSKLSFSWNHIIYIKIYSSWNLLIFYL